MLRCEKVIILKKKLENYDDSHLNLVLCRSIKNPPIIIIILMENQYECSRLEYV